MKLFRGLVPFFSLCAILFGMVSHARAQAGPPWLTLLGDHEFNYLLALAPAPDGGWMTAGGTVDIDKDVGDDAASYWLARLDSNGIPLWQMFFDTTQGNAVFSAIVRTRQGYIIGGQAIDSFYDRWHESDTMPNDAVLISIDTAGTIQWANAYGGSRNDELASVIQLQDGGYAFVGTTNSNDGDVHDFKGDPDVNAADVWVERVDSTGAILWEKTFGGSGLDLGVGLTELTDHSLAVVANTRSSDGDVTFAFGGYDIWVLHLDSTGKLLWQQTFGTAGSDETIGVLPAPNGAMIVAGRVAYSDTENAVWVTKLASDGSPVWQNNLAEWEGYTPWSMAASTPGAHDGGVLLAGQYAVGRDTLGSWVALIDSDGHTRWRNPVSFEGPSGIFFKKPVMNALYADLDGGFTIAGSGEYDTLQLEGFVDRYTAAQEAVREAPIANAAIEVFPMPATSTLRIRVPVGFAGKHFSLYNAIGVSIQGFDVPAGSAGIQLDVSSLPRGIYYIESVSSAGIIHSPVLLQ